MTLRTNDWLKNHFAEWDPDDYNRDLVDSMGNATWMRAVTHYFVSSTHASASDSNPGTDPTAPLATIDGAFGKTLLAGDIVWVLPNHVEDLAAAQIDMDLPDVYVIGVGSGDSKPRINFNNAASSVNIGANNITVVGLRFQPAVTDVLIGVDIETTITGTVIAGCEFMVGEDGAGVDEFVLSVDVKAACNRTKIVGNEFYTDDAAAGATDAVKFTGASHRWVVKDNVIQGTYSNAGITNDTTACEDVVIQDNVIKVADGLPGITLMAATQGRIVGNMIASTGLDPDITIVAAACEWFENYAVDADGETGQLIGVPSDSPTNFVGLNDANNDALTDVVVANEDGSILERLEQIQEAVNVGAGTPVGAASSLVDAIGSNGVAAAAATAASAVSLFGAIGTNEVDATTPFVSGNVQHNADGSVLERLEHLQVVQEVAIAKLDGNVLNGDDPLFTITGGPIMVTDFIGIVTTLIGGAANCTINANVAAPAATTALSTTVAIDNNAVGTSYTFTAASPGVLTPTAAGVLMVVPEMRWLVPIGEIVATCSAAQDGVIEWYMFYRPLSPDTVVTVAA